MKIVFLGPPGSGKGTQAQRLSASLRIPHVSTGEMMRSAIREGSPLGKRVQGYLDQGKLVPDDLINEVVADRLARPDCRDGFLLDGFPRTIAQAEALDAILARTKGRISNVIELTADSNALVDRLVKRGKLEGRSDDTEDVIRERLRVYTVQTQPLSDFYAKQAVLTKVDGLGTIEEVEGRVKKACGR